MPPNMQPIKMKKGGKTKSRVNEAGNYTKPGMRKKLFNKIKAGGKGGKTKGIWKAFIYGRESKRYSSYKVCNCARCAGHSG